MKKLLPLWVLLILATACQQQEMGLVEELLHDNDDLFGEVLGDLDRYEVQIIYTQIDRNAANTPKFTQHRFRVDSSAYFYPASTIKMPVAILAMEKINNLHLYTNIPQLSQTTPLRIGAARPPQTAVATDSTAENGLPSVAHYVKKIFTVSDNDANNRLYEFLGQDYINNTLAAKGFTDTRILHRLGASGYTFEDNKYTNPIEFYTGDTVMYRQPELMAQRVHANTLSNVIKGKAYMDNEGNIINEPFDFTNKNFFALTDFEKMMRAVMFADYTPKEEGFALTEEDYAYLYKCMSILPRESKYPQYAESEFFDGYCKFFMYGDTKDRIPDHIRIFNKVGFAYGYLTDCSYIVDFENNVEFILAATIHVNDNKTYNDGKYEYDEVGLPFLANLGRVIYEYDKNRTRNYEPDLSRFMIEDYE